MELTIDVINRSAMHLLGSMEQMQLIKVYERGKPEKLSDKFRGKLNLSDKEYNDFQDYLKTGRNEWERSI